MSIQCVYGEKAQFRDPLIALSVKITVFVKCVNFAAMLFLNNLLPSLIPSNQVLNSLGIDRLFTQHLQLFKLSRRPGLRRSSIRLLHQTGRTRRRRNSFACRVVKNWNRLPFAVASVTEQRKFKQL